MSGKWIRPLICPVCAQPLGDYGQVWHCPAGHSFDVAREGYVNLLRRHKKLPDTVGDAPEMLRARWEFLARGFYEPLSDVVNGVVATAVADHSAPVIVDVGCGEGYYLRRLAARLAGQPAALFGVDIAKTAVRLAAKGGGGHGRYLVADINEQLPFADHSVHVLLNLFAPRHPAEFARLVIPGGLLLIVIPAPDHLQSLRDRFALMGIQAQKEAHITAQFASLFAAQPAQMVIFPLQLDALALSWLIQMMPGVRHLTLPQQEAIVQTPTMETVARFVVLTMRREA
ncbi:MAG: methyltransferase domain-containing protein [Chloroflexi bacterium]|nr:methyltransferase domain-containing protein [Ardenticatenaceae bacterium]MBL1126893.1 methyltransferase domain-containing protein [Chloroflexota bacterium]NOG32949.1 methyltransferase domain-containing protein [Chloroflexota bacterium]